MDPTPTEAPAPTGLDQPAEVNAPVEGTQEQASFDAPFNINDVAEEYRGDVERYVKQTQAAFTRKTQELAQQRSQYEQATSLVEALQSGDPDAQQRALQALNLELVTDDPAQHAADPFGEEPDPLAQLRAELDQLKTERQAELTARQEEQHFQRIDTHVEDQFRLLGEERGTPLTDTEKELALALAATSLDPDQQGMPQVAAALRQLRDYVDGEIRAYVDGKRAVQQPPSQGVPGQDAFDIKNPDHRISALVDAIAQRSGALT